jgi:hypothetical protein
MIKTSLLQKIPTDIITNIILPFLYNPQPKILLDDIKNFYLTFSKLENFYAFEYNYFIMFEDLKNVFLYGEENFCITNEFYYIFKRHFMFNNMNYIQIANYVYKKYAITDKFPKNKCKFLWSLLTINERKNFIKNYVDYINKI